ncbi:MAG: hypothetical protein LUD72_05390, partial [Bacteroidales bacterium]|nr:hypothetical protein [Bacteroidales bacterium]
DVTVTIYVESDEAGVYWKHTLTEDEKIEVPEAENDEDDGEPETDTEQEGEEGTSEGAEDGGKIDTDIVEPGYYMVTIGGKIYYFAIDGDANGMLYHVTEKMEITLTDMDLSEIGTLYVVWDKTGDVIIEVGIKITSDNGDVKTAVDIYYTDKVISTDDTEYYVVTVEDGYTFIGTISTDAATGVATASISEILRNYTIGSDGSLVVVKVSDGSIIAIAIYDETEKELVVTDLNGSNLEKVEEANEGDGSVIVDTCYKVTVDGVVFILTLNGDGTATIGHVTEEVEVTYSDKYGLTIEMDLTDGTIVGGTFTWTEEAGDDDAEDERKSYTFTANCVKVTGDETYYLVTINGMYTLKISKEDSEYTATAAYVTYVVEGGYAYITIAFGDTDTIKGLYVYDSATDAYVRYDVTVVSVTEENETDDEGVETVVATYCEVTVEGVSYILTFADDMTAAFADKTGEIALTLNDEHEFFLVYDYTADTFICGVVYYDVEVEAETGAGEGGDSQAAEPRTETVTERYEFSVICRKVTAEDDSLQYYVTVNTRYGYILTLDEYDGELSITVVAGDGTEAVQP